MEETDEHGTSDKGKTQVEVLARQWHAYPILQRNSRVALSIREGSRNSALPLHGHGFCKVRDFFFSFPSTSLFFFSFVLVSASRFVLFSVSSEKIPELFTTMNLRYDPERGRGEKFDRRQPKKN